MVPTWPADPNHHHRQWLAEILPRHERVATGATLLIETMLKKKHIEFLSVRGRVKTVAGAIEKIGRKEYRNPQEQLTDLSGVRIVTYLEEHVRQISDVVKELFEIDRANSLNRTEILGDDKVGYRSTHFVCKLGKKRKNLPEYESLGDLKFEIQIRTVLQHAWAELAHDRSFKFGAALPVKIQRKLNLYSGMLEIADSAFDEISKEIETYSASLKTKTIKQIKHLALDSISLGKFLDDLQLSGMITLRDDKSRHPKILDELSRFGVQTVGDLEKLISSDVVREFTKGSPAKAYENYHVTRAAMLLKDLPKSLRAIPHPHRISPRVLQILMTKYDPIILEKAIADNAIEIVKFPSEKLEPVPRGAD